MWAKPLAGESDGVKEECDGGRRFSLFTGRVAAVFCFRELLKGQDDGGESAAALLVGDNPTSGIAASYLAGRGSRTAVSGGTLQ